MNTSTKTATTTIDIEPTIAPVASRSNPVAETKTAVETVHGKDATKTVKATHSITNTKTVPASMMTATMTVARNPRTLKIHPPMTTFTITINVNPEQTTTLAGKPSVLTSTKTSMVTAIETTTFTLSSISYSRNAKRAALVYLADPTTTTLIKQAAVTNLGQHLPSQFPMRLRMLPR